MRDSDPASALITEGGRLFLWGTTLQGKGSLCSPPVPRLPTPSAHTYTHSTKKLGLEEVNGAGGLNGSDPLQLNQIMVNLQTAMIKIHHPEP